MSELDKIIAEMREAHASRFPQWTQTGKWADRLAAYRDAEGEPVAEVIAPMYSGKSFDVLWEHHANVSPGTKLYAAPPPPRAEVEALERDAARYRWLLSLKSGRPESQIALAHLILAMRKSPDAVGIFIDEQIDRALLVLREQESKP